MKEEREYDSSNIWRKSRYDGKLSQEYMANYLGISRKTVQNWENGVSAPDINQGAKWFEALGINPLPYFLGYVYPETIEGIKPSDSDEKIDKALRELIDSMPVDGKRQLLYMFYGDHGSSPRALLNLVTAHLHLPMRERVIQASVVINNYEMDEALGLLVGGDHIKPDVENVKNAIEAAKNAAINHQDGYMNNL